MRVLGPEDAKAEEIQQGKEGNGAPGKSRTCDLLVRSQTLYPAELRALRYANAVQLDYDTLGETSTISIAFFARSFGISRVVRSANFLLANLTST